MARNPPLCTPVRVLLLPFEETWGLGSSWRERPVEDDPMVNSVPSVAWSSPPAKRVLPSYHFKKEKTRKTVTETICGPQSLKSLLSGLGQKVGDPWIQGWSLLHDHLVFYRLGILLPPTPQST